MGETYRAYGTSVESFLTLLEDVVVESSKVLGVKKRRNERP